ncbi:unnamed protein product, partial [Ectocarpus fasciculatus]
RQPVILVADPGVDDAAAVLYALANPQLEILGICANFGVVDAATAAKNTLLLVEKAGAADVSVYLGADHPLGELPRAQRGAAGGRNFHGPHGLGPGEPVYPGHLSVNTTVSAVEFILQTCRSRPGEVSVVVFSPPTTLAQAVSADPRLVSYVKAVYVMGGALFSAGNTSPLAEANFANDAAGTALVIAQFSEKLTIAPLDTTLQVLYSENVLPRMAESCGETANWLLGFLAPFYLKAYRDIAGAQRSTGFMPLHDVHALMALTNPEIYKSQRMAVVVTRPGDATNGMMFTDRRS